MPASVSASSTYGVGTSVTRRAKAPGASYLNGFLKLLGRAKPHLPAGLDLDGRAGCWIAAHAGFAGFDLEDTQPAHADPLALLQMAGHRGNKICQQRTRLRLRQV